MFGEVSDAVKMCTLPDFDSEKWKRNAIQNRKRRALPDIALRFRISVHTFPVKIHIPSFFLAMPLFFLSLKFWHQDIDLKSAFLSHL